MSISIGFDFAHAEKGNLKNTYKTLRDLLDSEKFRMIILKIHELPFNYLNGFHI